MSCEEDLARARLEYETMVRQVAALDQMTELSRQRVAAIENQIRAMPQDEVQAAFGSVGGILDKDPMQWQSASTDDAGETTETRGSGAMSPVVALNKRKAALNERLTALEART